MKWISVKDRLPTEDIVCYVINSRYGGSHVAIYFKSYNVFLLYDPGSHITICLDVTHWLKLPDPPEDKCST